MFYNKILDLKEKTVNKWPQGNSSFFTGGFYTVTNKNKYWGITNGQAMIKLAIKEIATRLRGYQEDKNREISYILKEFATEDKIPLEIHSLRKPEKTIVAILQNQEKGIFTIIDPHLFLVVRKYHKQELRLHAIGESIFGYYKSPIYVSSRKELVAAIMPKNYHLEDLKAFEIRDIIGEKSPGMGDILKEVTRKKSKICPQCGYRG